MRLGRLSGGVAASLTAAAPDDELLDFLVFDWMGGTDPSDMILIGRRLDTPGPPLVAKFPL